MNKFRRVTVVGVGLLGGSVGLALKKRGLCRRVVGFFRNKKKIRPAIKRGVVDEGTDDFGQAVRGSDLIILCSPVGDIIAKLELLKRMDLGKAIVTDTGSTKTKIMAAATGLNFVGGHPLAGSEQSGAEYSRADLFEDSPCVLTSGRTTCKNTLEDLVRLWKSLGATPVVLDAETHDRILAFVSHLPHVLAYALMQTVPSGMLRFAAGGLKDATRVALSSPVLWHDIFLSNKPALLASLRVFEKQLATLKKALARDDSKILLRFLDQARRKRTCFPPR